MNNELEKYFKELQTDILESKAVYGSEDVAKNISLKNVEKLFIVIPEDIPIVFTSTNTREGSQLMTIGMIGALTKDVPYKLKKIERDYVEVIKKSDLDNWINKKLESLNEILQEEKRDFGEEQTQFRIDDIIELKRLLDGL